MHGEPGTSEHCLVSQLFDVDSSQMKSDARPVSSPKIKIAWGSGIAGHVAKSGQPISIEHAYQVRINHLTTAFPCHNNIIFFNREKLLPS